MRRVFVVLGLAALACVAGEGSRPGPAVAAAFQRPNLELARTAFAAVPSDDRIGLHLMLMATGDFNAMAADRLGARLYDAIARFQAREGLMPTGIPDPATMARAHLRGDTLLSALRLHAVDVPSAAASLFVPGAFGLVATPTPRGLAYENADRSMSLDVSFFPAADSAMADIFVRLSEARPGRRIDMKVIRDGFFAVAGGGDAMGFYSRTIPVAGGTAGFTLAWNTDRCPNGNRVAVLMANGLMASRKEPLPAPPPPVAPPQQASLEPPARPAPKADPPKPVTVTGSAFFVSVEGDLVTNAHVVKGCASATITGRGTAYLVAKDAKNDLALLRLDTKPAAPLTPAVFRRTPLQLGEAVYGRWLPHCGRARQSWLSFSRASGRRWHDAVVTDEGKHGRQEPCAGNPIPLRGPWPLASSAAHPTSRSEPPFAREKGAEPMDNDTTAFPKPPPSKPGHHSGPVLVWRRRPEWQTGAHKRRCGPDGHELGAADRELQHQG